MVIRKFFYCIVLAIPFLSSCNYFGAGTHGSIKSYNYPVKKSVLQGIVYEVIGTNPNIHRIDTVQKNFIVYITNGKSDTIHNGNHFNDGIRYLGIEVENSNGQYEYTFQFTGSEKEWDTSRVSNISIAYASDENGNGGSDGGGDFPWYRYRLRKKLVKVFEQEFIGKIDSLLGMKHTEE